MARDPQLIDLLKPFQAKWARDASRWKFGLWARQTGKDFTSAFEGIHDCAMAEARKRKTTWLIASPSERQSLESLEKWKEWAEAEGLVASDYREERGGPQALLKAATITFPGGSRVIAVPGRPDTVRGYSANVLMTEFAFFEDPDATWRAILPSVTNPLRGGLKKVRLITTPNGIGNKAHDIWVKNFGVKSAAWSCHKVTIHDAVAQGLPMDIDEIREAIDDPEGWAQEFECEFLDVQSTLLPYELIATCESADAHEVCPAEFWEAPLAMPLVMGIDFGRRRDLTVAWTLQEYGPSQMTREVLALDKTSTDRQVEILSPRIRRCRRVCLDYTGPGVGLGDYLAREFGEWNPEKHQFGKIELCQFTNALKVDIYSKLRMAFEKKEVFVPATRAVREDLHSVNRVSTATGAVTYRAPHTADGHADRCTALALANRARADAGISSFACTFPDSRVSQILAERRERTVMG